MLNRADFKATVATAKAAGYSVAVNVFEKGDQTRDEATRASYTSLVDRQPVDGVYGYQQGGRVTVFVGKGVSNDSASLWERATWTLLHELGHAEAYRVHMNAGYQTRKKALERDAWKRGAKMARTFGLPDMSDDRLAFANRCLDTYKAAHLKRSDV